MFKLANLKIHEQISSTSQRTSTLRSLVRYNMGKISSDCIDMYGASPDEEKMGNNNLTSSLIGLRCQSL